MTASHARISLSSFFEPGKCMIRERTTLDSVTLSFQCWDAKRLGYCLHSEVNHSVFCIQSICSPTSHLWHSSDKCDVSAFYCVYSWQPELVKKKKKENMNKNLQQAPKVFLELFESWLTGVLCETAAVSTGVRHSGKFFSGFELSICFCNCPIWDK